MKDSLDKLIKMMPQLCLQHNQPIQTFNRLKKPLCQICLFEQSGMTPVDQIQNQQQETLRNASMELNEQRLSLQTFIESLYNYKKELLSELEKIRINIYDQIIQMDKSEKQFQLICSSRINQFQCIEEIEGEQLLNQQKYQGFRSIIKSTLKDFQQKYFNNDHLLKEINKNHIIQNQANTLNKVKIQVKNQEDNHLSNDSTVFFIKGVALDDLGKYQDAIYCYDEAIKLKPNYPEAYFQKGNSLHNLSNYQDAIQCYDEAIKLNPNYPEAYFSKGNSLKNQSKYQDAIQCYDEAIKLNPQLTKAIHNRQRVIQQLQKQKKISPLTKR